MSEALPGVPPAPPAAKVRAASSVILFRRHVQGAEVFWLKREKTLRFAGGFYAFPGGKLDPADRHVPVRGEAGEAAALIVAAARELFEETGILKVRGAGLAQARLDELRRAVLAGTLSFADLLARHDLSLDVEDFGFAGRWVTPPWLPVRFDARFFLVEAPEQQHATVWPGELESGAWTLPVDALSAWEKGAALLHPPALHVLQVMSRFTSRAQALAELPVSRFLDEEYVSNCIEFQRGTLVFPMPTPTLPPATHTNTYILGTRDCLIVDPGAPDERDTNRLISFIRSLEYTPKAVVLTHQHLDHVGGARHVSEAFGIPVWAHALTAGRVPVPVSRTLDEGDVLEVDGPLVTRWRVLHTPGHARGHLCLVNVATGLGVVGDMVSGLGTIVIDPPEGDMAEYLRQLERLKSHLTTLCPAHGPPSPDAVAKLDEYLMHRAWREAKVLEALASFGRAVSVEELVTRAYDDVQSFIWPIAERNTVAILEKLRAEGRVQERDGAWSA